MELGLIIVLIVLIIVFTSVIIDYLKTKKQILKNEKDYGEFLDQKLNQFK
jgi:hypothetical protein